MHHQELHNAEMYWTLTGMRRQPEMYEQDTA